MEKTLTEKIIEAHVRGDLPAPGDEIALAVDQTLTQDATGTLVMLELEALGLDRVRTELSVQYVDHNLVQEDHKNPDDHRFLWSASRRFGLWFSPPGNGVSHPVHQERFGRPGATLVGSDSHTPAAGALGMLALGAGGLEVALAMAGEPLYLTRPQVWGIRLEGELEPWVSAKDVILELLRRHGVAGGRGRVLEYYGPGVATLSAMDRHVIANMGTELGATSSVFPSDDEVRRFLRSQRREAVWEPLAADEGASFDHHDVVDLSTVEPLIAMPSSPGNVVPVREVEGRPIYQAYVGSSANPGYRDFAVAAEIVAGKTVHPQVSFDVNPSSRQILANLAHRGHLAALIQAGARIHQAGCNGCIGMGQAPATDQISLRTVPRNFPGRSGTREDKVCLVSPETAAASALSGVITDPRTRGAGYPRVSEPSRPLLVTELLQPPLGPEDSAAVELIRGPNIHPLPELAPLPDELDVPVVLAMGDDVSTDEILPAGTRVLPLRSNIPKIAEFSFAGVDEEYPDRARAADGAHAVVAGKNYGQGSSREHAALAPRYLGLRVVVAVGYARIHWQNLVNFGVLPLRFADPGDRERVRRGDRLRLGGVREALRRGTTLEAEHLGRPLGLRHDLSARQVEAVIAGGLIPRMRERLRG